MSIDPFTLTLASMAISGATGIASYMAAEAEQDAVQQNAEATYQNDLDVLRLQQEEDEKAAEEDMLQNKIKAIEAKATAKTAAGEAGVAGLSVDSLMADYDRQEANYKSSILGNLETRTAQRNNERTAAHNRLQSRVNSAPGGNLLNTGLSIAGDWADTYGGYKTMSRNT